MKITEAATYREVLHAQIRKNPQRGYKGELAVAMRIHSSYLTRVISGDVHLTPDQAADLAGFWKLSERETRAFLLLVMRERAGSPALRKSLDQQLAEIRAQDTKLSTQIEVEEGVEDDHSLYYSSWHYPAIHVLLLNPLTRSAEKLSSMLQLPRNVVLTALAELVRMRLAEKTSGTEWRPIVRDMHLPDQEMWAPINHASWRQKAALRIAERRKDELHYSGVHTCTKGDHERIRKLWMNTLLECRKIASDSPGDDENFVLLFDVFSL